MKKCINNIKNNHHLNSKYWQHYKKNLPLLPRHVFSVAVGMILGDASIYKVSREAYIKFKQGHKQSFFLHDLFCIFKTYVFMEKPQKRFYSSNVQKGKVKSFWFKTFSHCSFTELFNLFYSENSSDGKFYKRKTISENLIKDYLTPRKLAYWIMCDGSLQTNKKTLILHTQSFNFKENCVLSLQLNDKFKLNTKVIKHKIVYYVIEIPAKHSTRILFLIKPYIIDSMKYKLPCLNKSKN